MFCVTHSVDSLVSTTTMYSKTARNFNPAMCRAAKVSIAEVEEIVDVGDLDPDEIHVPGIYVQRIIQGDSYEKRIEVFPTPSLLVSTATQWARSRSKGRLQRRTTRQEEFDISSPAAKVRHTIASRAALEFKDGMYGASFCKFLFLSSFPCFVVVWGRGRQ